MEAPCGIEIKIGQVWRLGEYAPLTICGFDNGLGGPAVKAFSEEVGPLRPNLICSWEFTNGRGGYRLVKEV